MFKHFVITQFNLKKFPLAKDTKENWENWTRERITLFKTYCLPSFLNQTNKNFTWLIYFDKETPPEFKYLIDELEQVNFAQIRFADGFDNFMLNYREDMRALAADTRWMIETRCDNDDSLEKDAIQTIQRNFKASDGFMISLASGYTLNTDDNTLSHYYYPTSPFVSLVEAAEKKDLIGIFDREHTEWEALRFNMTNELLGRNNQSVFAFEKPYWIQIIHGKNLYNTFNRGLPVLKSRDLSNFGIPVTTTKQSFLKIPAYYNYVLWKRYLKSAFVRMFSKS